VIDGLLAGLSLATAGIGTGCCLAGRHAGIPAVASMTVMLVAMADTMLFDGAVLASWAWAAILVAIGMAGLAALRRSADAGPMETLRSLHMIVMGVLVLAMAVGHDMSGASPPGSGHHHAGTGVAPVLVVALGAALGYAVACAFELRRHDDVLVRAELTAAVLSTVAMAAMPHS
jgi:hypothetical protein